MFTRFSCVLPCPEVLQQLTLSKMSHMVHRETARYRIISIVREALAPRPSHSLAIVHVGSAHFSATTIASTIVCVVVVSAVADALRTRGTVP